MPTAQTNSKALPEYPCDICGQHVEDGESYTVTDNGLTVEHTDCTRHWFRRNYGREYLS